MTAADIAERLEGLLASRSTAGVSSWKRLCATWASSPSRFD
ncbi:MAG: hypothetical protein R3A10_00515 [Caldilineaceae bacterium]